ncbi:PASTA domain-containing protein [Actinoplanes sp. NPDC051470]|uniref:PASTA domain-containing protein n=1 Tax=Actinoplanes sp. NPDC051470 TaxID=3157224 RepID=UPI00343E7A47
MAVGLAEEELRNALTRRGLGWEIVYVAATEPPGTVVTVDPAEGERIETGGVVKVSVSTGEPVTASPDPTGGDTD